MSAQLVAAGLLCAVESAGWRAPAPALTRRVGSRRSRSRATPPREIVDNSVAGLRRTCVIFGPDPEICDEPTLELSETPGRATKGRAMSYCITLRSRTDARITGWYAGRNTWWSTDQTRQRRFKNQHDAIAVCHELRSRCPRNAEVINIEVAQDDAREKISRLRRISQRVNVVPFRRGLE
jgi:hypothetical protein